MASSDPASSTYDVPLQEIIFSCDLCQKTVSEVYASKESNHGFHSRSGDDGGIVTKMWIGECSHIMCGRHLHGGAAPFHPEGVQPRAPCPVCAEAGDDTPRDLYGIRGLKDGEHDAAIPGSWMECPPIKLDGAVPGMEAVRFQYMHLARYALRVTRHWKDAQRRHQTMEAACSKEGRQKRQLQSGTVELKAQMQRLEKAEVRLKKWEDRKPAINHYLAVVGEMAKDIEHMRKHLLQLGFQVPERKYSFDPGKGTNLNEASTTPRRAQDELPAPLGGDYSSSSRKRKHAVYTADDHQDKDHEPRQQRRSSRDLMPPPTVMPRLPKRDALPTIDTHNLPPFSRRASTRHPIQVYEDHAWNAQSGKSFIDRDFGRSAQPLPQPSPQRTLPLRPSPVRIFRERNLNDDSLMTDLDHPDHLILRAGSRANQHPIQPLAQLQLGSPRHGQNDFARSHTGHGTSQYDDRRWSYPSRPRITEHDANYDDVPPPQKYQARRPLQESSPSYLNQQSPKISRTSFTPAAISVEAQIQPDHASVISPFFNRSDALLRPTATEHLPMNRNDIRSQREPPSRNNTRDHRMLLPHSRDSGGRPLNPSLNSLSFIDRPHRVSDNQPLYLSNHQSERQRYGRDRLKTPQTPRNAQGLIQRPELPPPPSVSYVPSGPESNMHYGRVSFLPSQRTGTAVPGSQKQILSQIAGVRGARSQVVRTNASQYPPQRDVSRTLFSSAGGRRSVQR